MTAITASDIRGRRRRLGITRLALAVRTGVSTTWLAELEAGRSPHGPSLARVLDELDRAEAEAPLEAA